MGTRATYQFNKKDSEAVTIYHHWDGYIAGAATLFMNATKNGGEKLTAESFLNANEKAEITESHESHGDTEYRYTINESTGSIHISAKEGWQNPRWLHVAVIHNAAFRDLVIEDNIKMLEKKLQEVREESAKPGKYSATLTFIEGRLERVRKSLQVDEELLEVQVWDSKQEAPKWTK